MSCTIYDREMKKLHDLNVTTYEAGEDNAFFDPVGRKVYLIDFSGWLV